MILCIHAPMSRPLILIVMCLGVITGCQHSHIIADLVTFTHSIQANTQVTLEPLPSFASLPVYIYSAHHYRSPFSRPNRAAALQEPDTAHDCLTPDFTRKTSSLEQYGIDSFTMVGRIITKHNQVALFKTNDGKLHSANVGDYLGLFHGKISHIAADHILLTQLIPDGGGCYHHKQIRVTLNEKTGAHHAL